MKSERMLMMNVIGKISDMDSVISHIIDRDVVQLVDSNDLISHSEFLFPISDENVNIAVDFNYIKKYKTQINIKEEEKKLDKANKYLRLNLNSNKKLNPRYVDEINQIYADISKCIDELEKIEEKENERKELASNFNLFKNVNIEIEKLSNMKNFKYKFGVLSKDDRLKIKKNYENIFAAIFHLAATNSGEVYLILYPTSMEVDVNRTLKSLSFQEMSIPSEYNGTPSEIVKGIDKSVKELDDERDKINDKLQKIKEEYGKDLVAFLIEKYNTLNIEAVKSNVAVSDHYFFLSGWIGESDSEKLKRELESKYEITVQFNNMDDTKGVRPPTKLKNNILFRPFELLIKMYGTPNYNEVDPTAFFAITYMILFGSMFGDAGQGLVFVLAGIAISKLFNKDFGGLLIRLGFSSIVFGFLYGSFFGLEDVIPALFIRPYDNINKILIMAIVLGIVLLLLSYGLGIYNLSKEHNLEEFAFGEKGITGLVLYLLLLNIAASVAIKFTLIPMPVTIVLIVVCIALMILKKPLSNRIQKKSNRYDGEEVSGYYIEGSFSIIETLLSIFSGTVSFIRVGAFAINHVGLFLAFSTIGKMIGTDVGNVVMLVLGNILIIGLEGLIVFIQSLRLEYYEMFSKYYKGDGIDFVANKNVY